MYVAFQKYCMCFFLSVQNKITSSSTKTKIKDKQYLVSIMQPHAQAIAIRAYKERHFSTSYGN